MARGLNGSANGSGGHVPTGREAVEARLPGVSNLPPAVAGALPAVVGLRTTVPKDRRSAQTLGSEREGHGVLISDDGLIVTLGYLVPVGFLGVLVWLAARPFTGRRRDPAPTPAAP